MDRESVIRKLFVDTDVQFVIPPYQRAYSWEKDKQVRQFVLDLREQNEKKKYFFGHFLFEKDERDENKFWVIDGQQRLTSIVIFMSCMLKNLEAHKSSCEAITNANGDTIELWRTGEIYLRIDKKRKFKTVAYDDNYFENLVLNHDETVIANTDSKHKIRDAYDYFSAVLEQASLPEILKWKKTIEEAVVTTFEVSDKVQATQIFAFQNDRGKDLTELEKLKALLMYQIYLNSEAADSIDAIQYVEREFSEIYEMTERIERLNEDQVLSYFSIGFLKGWDAPLENIKKELAGAADKEHWIKQLCTSLKNTFANTEQIEKRAEGNSHVGDVLILDGYNSWPLLLKIYHFHAKRNDLSSIDKLEEVIGLMETTLFKMVYSHGDYRTNDFHNYAKHYDGDLKVLTEKLSQAAKSGFKWYWAFDDNFHSYLNGKHHYNTNTRYLLWKYENHLRLRSKVAPMPASEFLNKFGKRNLDNTIEHITPVNPEFNEYSDAFRADYLNNLGNLVLMTLGKNAQLSNASPADKAKGFQSSTLISQKMVGDSITTIGKWTEDEIQARHNSIVSFALERWRN